MGKFQRRHMNNDELLWKGNLRNAHSRILNVLQNNGFVVIDYNIILDIDLWDKSIHDTNVILTNYDDIYWDNTWFNDLKTIAETFNIKFTLITNVYYSGNNTKWYKVVFLKELYGVFYNPSIPINSNHGKLYSCLLQRTTYHRLKLFQSLHEHNLLEMGIVSLLGYQSSKLSPSEIVGKLNEDFDNVFEDIMHMKFPYKNFQEKNNNYEIEIDGKYTIVSESYNDSGSPQWISFTEKTFRSIQLPTISLLLNKQYASLALIEMGFKIHPINRVLTYIDNIESQNNFVVGLLTHDIFNDVYADMASYNQTQLGKWNTVLNSPEFYDSIIGKILQ